MLSKMKKLKPITKSSYAIQSSISIPRRRRGISRFPRTTVLATAALVSSIHTTCRVDSFGIVPLPQLQNNQWWHSSPSQSDKLAFRRRFSAKSLTDDMTEDALAMIHEAIQAVDPKRAIASHLKAKEGRLSAGLSLTYNAKDFDNVLLISFGKASSAMAMESAELVKQAMPDVKMKGIVVVKDTHASQEDKDYLKSFDIEVYDASHPIPDERSVEAAKLIMDSVDSAASSRTLVLCCISGGGSSLFCYPKSNLLSIDDLQQTNSCLLACGMTIQEINVIRKRLEDGKGGWLAAQAYPSTILTLVLSDVIGDPLDLIASGPTVPDSSTWEDAWALVEKYKLDSTGNDFCLPQSALNVLKMGLDGELDDTPKSDHPVFAKHGRCETVLVGNNGLAVLAAATEARRRGYNPVILGTQIEGEAKEAAGMYVAMAQHLAQQDNANSSTTSFAMAKLPAALIGGGETTVTLSGGNGRGGRNQELALAAALGLKKLNLKNVVLASAGTDGTDGPTDAAGAVVDRSTIDRLDSPSLTAEDALQNHDAYNYFRHAKDNRCPLIMTGPTGTNVADVCVTLVK